MRSLVPFLGEDEGMIDARTLLYALVLASVGLIGCPEDERPPPEPVEPATSPERERVPPGKNREWRPRPMASMGACRGCTAKGSE